MLLTPQRLLKISSNSHLANLWYLIATVTLTVCNQPQEIPAIYHYAMRTKHLHELPSVDLYQKVLSTVDRFHNIRDTGKDPHYTPYPDEAFQTTEKFRESILKTCALSGLPKAINSLMILKDTTPYNLRRHDNEATNRAPIKSFEEYQAVQKRGREFWDGVYTKVSHRIINQMASSYPDLWQYAIRDVYSDLLSYCGVLSHEETSVIVISCLIPQDVNPQLKGHLKGALNSGVDVEILRESRRLAMEISEWCGVKWRREVASI
ncbi:DEKNAAC104402 [Brettanomyces naardenensis]|uniref:DEKNAAC104402 n=1 Tax=Brettanomyces naardenensis TaxID=13370 RepID=A0A448YQQ8_BRENA|nr:DEKNAAC104402 [Brettanomyces naardenensis]